MREHHRPYEENLYQEHILYCEVIELLLLEEVAKFVVYIEQSQKMIEFLLHH